MKFTLAFLVFITSSFAAAQGTSPEPGSKDYTANTLTFVLRNPPSPVLGVGASRLDNPGPCSYFYWVVARFLVGNATPGGPGQIPNSACTLTNGNQISWNPVGGATGYDVLRTLTATPPTGACNCAIATNISTTLATDTGTLSSYTVVTLDPASLICVVDNEPTGPGASQLTFEPPTCLITGGAGTGPPYKVASSTHTIIGDGSDEVVFTCPLVDSCEFIEYFSANQVLTPGSMVTGIFGQAPVVGFHSTKLKRGSTTYLLNAALVDSIISAGQRQINMEPGDQYIVNFTPFYAGDPFLFATVEAPLTGPLRFHMPIVPAQTSGDTVVFTDPVNFQMVANGQAFTPLDIAALAQIGGGTSASELVWNNDTGNTIPVSYTFKWNSATTLTVSDILSNTGGAQFTVQSASGFANGSASPSVPFPHNNIGGNLLWVAIGSDATITAPTDTQGNIYSLAVSAGKAAIYFATPAKPGPNTVTCNHSGSTGSTHCHIAEISGLLASPLDQIGSVASSATCSVTTSAPTSAANEFVAAFFYDGVSNKTLTAGTGYTQIQQTNNTTLNSAFSENSSNNINPAGTQTATCTGNGTDVLSQLITTFKAVAVYTPISTWEGPVVLSPGDKMIFDHNAPAGTTVFLNFLTWVQK